MRCIPFWDYQELGSGLLNIKQSFLMKCLVEVATNKPLDLSGRFMLWLTLQYLSYKANGGFMVRDRG